MNIVHNISVNPEGSRFRCTLIDSRFFGALFITVISYLFLLTLFGYESARYICIITVPLIFIAIFKNGKIIDLMLLYILFLVIFDNEVLNWTEYRIRPWYPIVLITYFLVFSLFTSRARVFSGSGGLLVLAIFYYLVISILFLLTEDFQSKLFNLKFWLFSVGLVWSLLVLSELSNLLLDEIIKIWLFVVLFSAIWGLLQYVGNISGFSGSSLQHDWYNISPSGFFSERTWYGQYSAIGLILSVYFFYKTRNIVLLLMVVLTFFGVVVSFSRSAVIVLLMGGIGYLIAVIVSGKFSVKLILYSLLLIALIAFSSLINLNDEGLTIYSSLEKFDLEDEGIQGRVEAVNIFFENVRQDPLAYAVGNGFYWDDTQNSSIGTAVGAKAANLYLSLWHVFGYLGLLFGVLLSLNIVRQYLLIIRTRCTPEAILGFVLLLSFLTLSFAVPSHQYPSSLVILFFSILILQRINHER